MLIIAIIAGVVLFASFLFVRQCCQRWPKRKSQILLGSILLPPCLLVAFGFFFTQISWCADISSAKGVSRAAIVEEVNAALATDSLTAVIADADASDHLTAQQLQQLVHVVHIESDPDIGGDVCLMANASVMSRSRASVLTNVLASVRKDVERRLQSITPEETANKEMHPTN